MKVKHFGRASGLLTLLAAGVAALAVAACGSSSQGSSTTGTGGSAGSSASRSPYVIGSIASETGTFASSDAPGAAGVKAWAQYVNDHGGIGGHPVQLTVKDDQGNPSVALSEVKAFASDKNVIALVGNVSSEIGSWGPVAAATGLPVVGEFPFTPVSYSTKRVFPQGTTFPSILYGQVYSAVKLAGDKNVGLYYCAEESSCAGSVAPVKADAAALGGHLVNAQGVSATAPNYDAVCQAAKRAGVESMILALGESTIVSVAQSCSSVGFHPNYVVQTTSVSPQEASISALNNHLYGVIQTAPWTADTTPAQQAFQAGIKAANVPASDLGAALSLGWTGGALFQTAMQKVSNSPSREAVTQALWGLPPGTTLGGMAPGLTYKANAPAPQQKCYFVMKLASGKWSSLNGQDTKTYCEP
jgi:branched-chain amino acid transport system substrate-binding protein